MLGSRDAGRAGQAAQPMADAGLPVTGQDNAGAAAAGDIVIVAVPYEGHEDLLKSLTAELAGQDRRRLREPARVRQAGRVLARRPRRQRRAGGRGGAARTAGSSRRSTTSAPSSSRTSRSTQVETDVLVLGEDREATDLVGRLADIVPGMRGIFAGRLRNAGQVEALTANLISVNRRYKAHAGLRVTDV